MTRLTRFFIFLALSLACLIAAGVLLLDQVARFNAVLSAYPYGTVIAGVPVGGLDPQAAGARIAQAYTRTPVELRIDGAAVHLDPAAAGQQLDLDAMLQSAAAALAERSYWEGFWEYLWNKAPAPVEADLHCAVSADTLRGHLQAQIGSRYDQPPVPAAPLAPADVLFQPGRAGTVIDLEGAQRAIQTALCEQSPRVVEIGVQSIDTAPPTVEQLDLLLQTLVQSAGFDGLAEVYYQDLASGKEINFAMNGGQILPPEVAFTAASTIKIPVMVSTYKRIDGELPAALQQQMAEMIDLSDNASTDKVMESALDPNIAPVQITQDMQALGLKNTFLAGFFYPGAPLLDRYTTPANQRADFSTDPDIYNQTTTADMGRLLAAIQRCAADGSGLLSEVFTGQVTQAECQQMTALLEKNRKGVLIENGLPEGTRMAHKYGWVTDAADDLMHTASDASIVYTPGGDFILTIYLYDAQQLNWDEAQRLTARLATAVYNFYNHWQ